MPSKFTPARRSLSNTGADPAYWLVECVGVEPAAFTKISTLGVEEQRVNVLIDIVAPEKDWAGLGDAFQVDARITVFSRDDATIVPAGALFRTGENLERLCSERRSRPTPIGDLSGDPAASRP